MPVGTPRGSYEGNLYVTTPGHYAPPLSNTPRLNSRMSPRLVTSPLVWGRIGTSPGVVGQTVPSAFLWAFPTD